MCVNKLKIYRYVNEQQLLCVKAKAQSMQKEPWYIAHQHAPNQFTA